MAQYSAKFRSKVLRKLLPPQSKTIGEVAAEVCISTATIYAWKAKINDSTLQIDYGAQGARHQQLLKKFSLLGNGKHLTSSQKTRVTSELKNRALL